ncbi:hypothetical protein WSM22_12850 [Cytophagales bacterium WSM2-2]|nr:hypothetical protein WSM22_12850 [Cytophagales bacterium WSM2-2]
MNPTHAALKKIVHSKHFCHVINYAIVAFAIFVGVETLLVGSSSEKIISVIENLFLLFFTVEILLRIFAEDHPIDFFNVFKTRKIVVQGRKKTEFEVMEHGVWNCFDFLLILISIIGLFANLFAFPGFLQVGRLFRIFRIVRLLEVSDHLKEVEKRIISIIPTVFSFAVLLLILTYIYSIVGMFMFDKKVFATANFSSITDSFITLFQVMTLDNWSDVMKDIRANTSFFQPIIVELYFISFVVFTAIIAFNVFVAVMTSQVQERLESDFEKKMEGDKPADQLAGDIRLLLNEIASLRSEVSDLKRKMN